MFPGTNYGRVILIFAAILGTILISLVIITLQTKFGFNPVEDNAFRFNERINEKEEIQKKGAQCFKSTFEFIRDKNLFVNHLKSEKRDPKEYKKLKQKLTDTVYNRIKKNKMFKDQFQ